MFTYQVSDVICASPLDSFGPMEKGLALGPQAPLAAELSVFLRSAERQTPRSAMDHIKEGKKEEHAWTKSRKPGTSRSCRVDGWEGWDDYWNARNAPSGLTTAPGDVSQVFARFMVDRS